MLPQDGTYGGTPTPRNDSAASVSTAAANTNEACTMTGDRQFGSTSRATITRSETASPHTRPMAKASSTTAAPTSSESRAPYTTRLQTSRPTSSVPNQCVAPGAVSRAETSMRSGSSAISGASTPTTVVMASNARPTTVARRRTRRTSQRARRRTGSAGLGSARTLMAGRDEPRRGANRAVKWFSLISDPGIEDDVREIHREIDEHVNAGDADDDALDDGIVAPQHRRDDQAPQAGN